MPPETETTTAETTSETAATTETQTTPENPGGAAAAAAAAQSAKWYDDDAFGFDDDTKGFLDKNGYPDVKTALKSAQEDRKLVGADKSTLLKMPEGNRADNPEGWAKFDQARGVPETFDKYDALPEIETMKDLHPEALEAFGDPMHKLGLDNQQRAGMFELLAGVLEKTAEGETRLPAFDPAAHAADLRKDFGAAFEDKVKTATLVTEEYFGKDFQSMLAETGLHQHKAIVSGMAKIGEMFQEAGVAPGALGGTRTSQTAAEAKTTYEAFKTKHGDALTDKSHKDHAWASKEQDRLIAAAYPS